MNKTWNFIQDKLTTKTKVMLLVVIDSHGSSPGRPGFKMAVAGDGTMTGSIGGGMTEYRLVEKAKKELKKPRTPIMIKHEIHQPDAEEDSSGMICSGEQWVAFYPVLQKDHATISQIISALNSGERGLIRFTQNGFDYSSSKNLSGELKRQVNSDKDWFLREETGNKNHLYIFGAGHVGSALSQVMHQLDFVIHLFDNRKNLNTFHENEHADHYQIIDYKNIAHLVPESDKSYVVIMTFGHGSDKVVLKQLINKDIKYLGMMGSDSKVDSVFKLLQKEGVEKERLQKVHAPIGISITSKTPR